MSSLLVQDVFRYSSMTQERWGPSSLCPRKVWVVEYGTISPLRVIVGELGSRFQAKHMIVLLEALMERPQIDIQVCRDVVTAWRLCAWARIAALVTMVMSSAYTRRCECSGV